MIGDSKNLKISYADWLGSMFKYGDVAVHDIISGEQFNQAISDRVDSDMSKIKGNTWSEVLTSLLKTKPGFGQFYTDWNFLFDVDVDVDVLPGYVKKRWIDPEGNKSLLITTGGYDDWFDIDNFSYIFILADLWSKYKPAGYQGKIKYEIGEIDSSSQLHVVFL